jgi:hypothetical protein
MSMPMYDARGRRRAETQAEQIHEAAARLVAERVMQGLPPKVTDPVVLARIAAILTSTDTPRASTDSPPPPPPQAAGHSRSMPK